MYLYELAEFNTPQSSVLTSDISTTLYKCLSPLRYFNKTKSLFSTSQWKSPVCVSCLYKASLQSEHHLLAESPPETSHPIRAERRPHITWLVVMVSEVSGAGRMKGTPLWLWIRTPSGEYFMKAESRVKIGIFFLVCGTLLILINNVLVKCYCEVFFFQMCDMSGGSHRRICSIESFFWTSWESQMCL